MNLVHVMRKGGVMKHKPEYWALSSDTTDERARELFEIRYGKQPRVIKRYPRCVLLLGPIVEGDDGK